MGADRVSGQLRGDKECPFSGVSGGRCRKAMLGVKLQALVYDILPSTTVVFSYAIGSRKLSANEQFFLLMLRQ